MIGALVAIGALVVACAPFSESFGDTPPVDPRRSDDPTLSATPAKATVDGGAALGDAGADAATTTPACNGAADCERVVFVTSEAILGSLILGVSGADAMCDRLAAKSANPRVSGRMYRAWISDDTRSPSTIFVHGTKPYVRPDGVRIASDYAHLTNGNALERPIEVDELGRMQAGSVWSATSASGEHDGAACYEWSSPYPRAGRAPSPPPPSVGRGSRAATRARP